ncbi:MAG: hypothetical protein AAFX06_27835 [Planctomycetota bacterium]
MDTKFQQLGDPSLFQLPLGMAILLCLFLGFGPADSESTPWEAADPIPMFTASDLTSEPSSNARFVLAEQSYPKSMGHSSRIAQALIRVGGPDFAEGVRNWVLDPLGMKKASRAITAEQLAPAALEAAALNPASVDQHYFVATPNTTSPQIKLVFLHGV